VCVNPKDKDYIYIFIYLFIYVNFLKIPPLQLKEKSSKYSSKNNYFPMDSLTHVQQILAHNKLLFIFIYLILSPANNLGFLDFLPHLLYFKSSFSKKEKKFKLQMEKRRMKERKREREREREREKLLMEFLSIR